MMPVLHLKLQIKNLLFYCNLLYSLGGRTQMRLIEYRRRMLEGDSGLGLRLLRIESVKK
jgi:hypothetical protein